MKMNTFLSVSFSLSLFLSLQIEANEEGNSKSFKTAGFEKWGQLWKSKIFTLFLDFVFRAATIKI